MYKKDFTDLELEHLRKEGIYFIEGKPISSNLLYPDEISNNNNMSHEEIMKSIRKQFPPGKNMYEQDFTPTELDALLEEGISFPKGKSNPSDFLYTDEMGTRGDNHEEVMNIIRMQYPPNEVMYK